MTLVPAAVILVGRADEAARRTVFFYVALTHLAGVGTWVAVLLLAREGAIGDAAVMTSGSGVQIAVALAALVGMGAKAGLMPLHVWLPLAHPIAPAPVSALMSGVMIKIAIYGLVRVLVDWLGVLPAVAWRSRARPRRAVGGRRGGLRVVPARAEAAARLSLDREHRDHRPRSRCVPGAARHEARTSGRRSHWRPHCCTPSTTHCSSRCCSSAPARSRGPSARWSSTGWGA